MAAAPRRPAADALPSEVDRILHDLRGPINAISLHLELLKHLLPDDDKARHSLQTIESAVRRLTRMLPAALSVVALESGSAARVGVRALVEGALREHEPGAVTLTGDRWPQVRGDRELLELALSHLVRNALAATAGAKSEQPPEICVEESGNTVTVVVRDWGVGLPRKPEALARLADGIGLLVVERIARLHGGSLAFAPPASARTEVRLTLPRA